MNSRRVASFARDAKSESTILSCREAEREVRRRGGSTRRLNGKSRRVDPTKPARFAAGRSHDRIVNFDLGREEEEAVVPSGQRRRWPPPPNALVPITSMASSRFNERWGSAWRGSGGLTRHSKHRFDQSWGDRGSTVHDRGDTTPGPARQVRSESDQSSTVFVQGCAHAMCRTSETLLSSCTTASIVWISGSRPQRPGSATPRGTSASPTIDQIFACAVTGVAEGWLGPLRSAIGSRSPVEKH